ncbi:cell division protein CrgA [Micrococcus sp.]|uniref:cell division protein CrgA n=1 Tax=Micrococcus sp. TaxID=1271 RepID=UPI002A9103D6|nr:cell division protein CrgA [Micrococcus sp.]MDY6055968.1 cell division protein CrgA [Micrococcus sp.]
MASSASDHRKDSARRKRARLESELRGRRGRRRPSVTTEVGGEAASGPAPLPRWYKAVMFGLLILGLLWVVTYYLTQGLFPVLQWGGWNIAVGLGIAMLGFMMMTRWSE